MYEQFFGLKERPFDLTPDPRFLYFTTAHREALAAVVHGIQERKGLISMTGEVGTGKTTILHAAFARIDRNTRIIALNHTSLSFDELLEFMALRMGYPDPGSSRALRLTTLEDQLRARASDSNGGTTALVVDEAHNLTEGLLEEIRMLSNIETEKEKLLQIVLVGQPELETKLNRETLRQLKQRISIRRQIRTLSEAETVAYVEHRLGVAGARLSEVFSTEALALVQKYAGGIPRTINIVCDNALLIAYSLAQKPVRKEVVLDVMADMEGGSTASGYSDSGPGEKSGDLPNLRKVATLRKVLNVISVKKAEHS